jgi:methionine synthase II (cobalamin-independent)
MVDIKRQSSLMIGSMPQQQPEAALHLLEKYPLSVPTWPQLPKRSFKEGMIPQFSEAFPGIRVDEKEKRIWVEQSDQLFEEMSLFYEKVVAEEYSYFALSDEFAAGLHYFLRHGMARGRQPLLKGQVTGPFTFGLGLNDNNGKAVWFDPQYRDVVIKGVTAKALWLTDQLKEMADHVILFFDEPILSALGTPAYIGIQDEDVVQGLNEVITALHQVDVTVGVHCCGNMDWGLLTRTQLDIISFDAYFYADRLILYPEEIEAFLQRGGRLAWGMVPTNDLDTLKQETPQSLRQKLIDTIQMFVDKGINGDRVRQQMILTPSCGIGSLDEEGSQIVLQLLAEIKAE